MASATALAASAASLATEVNDLVKRFSLHAGGLVEVSGELTLLSAAILHLTAAMTASESAYTPAFHEDLGEIVEELRVVLGEVEGCVGGLRAHAVKAPALGMIAALFNSGRARKFRNRLAAIKTTTVVMRTTIQHGKHYSVENYPERLAVPTLHSMAMEKAILEAVFADNRRAIRRSTGTFLRHSSQHGLKVYNSLLQIKTDKIHRALRTKWLHFATSTMPAIPDLPKTKTTAASHDAALPGIATATAKKHDPVWSNQFDSQQLGQSS